MHTAIHIYNYNHKYKHTHTHSVERLVSKPLLLFLLQLFSYRVSPARLANPTCVSAPLARPLLPLLPLLFHPPPPPPPSATPSSSLSSSSSPPPRPPPRPPPCLFFTARGSARINGAGVGHSARYYIGVAAAATVAASAVASIAWDPCLCLLSADEDADAGEGDLHANTDGARLGASVVADMISGASDDQVPAAHNDVDVLSLAMLLDGDPPRPDVLSGIRMTDARMKRSLRESESDYLGGPMVTPAALYSMLSML